MEANNTEALYPNLGMLANSHLGLTNIIQEGERPNLSRIVDRTIHPGTGAISPFEGLTFKTKSDSKISAGEEIFVGELLLLLFFVFSFLNNPQNVKY